MMSVHLAGMNEKLTQQKDEIDELKSQISNAKSSSSSSHSKVKFSFKILKMLSNVLIHMIIYRLGGTSVAEWLW
jgi:hypothetical protein